MNAETPAPRASVPSSKRPSLVVVAPWVYHLRCGIGGGVLCFRMLRHLAQHYDIHWVSFDTTANDVEAGKRALAEFCASVTTVPMPAGKPRWRGRLRQLLGGRPMAAPWSAAMESAIRDTIVRSHAAAVLFQFPQVAQFVGAAAGVPAIVDTQDVCAVSLYREWRKTQGTLKRLIKALNWLAWSRYELKHYGQADLLLAISDTDAGVLRAYLPDVPCHVSPVATEIPPSVERGAGQYVAMVGNFFHPPNIDGLRWLLEDIWPQVRARHPTVELRIAGPACPAPSPALEAQGIRMMGFVDDIDAFFDNAAVSLTPYRFGGGVKIKVLEALARSCPVVATPVGAEGLDLQHGQHLLVAAQADAFAEAIHQLLVDPGLARRIGEAGRSHIDRRFSYRSKTADLKQAFDALIERHRGRAAAAGGTTLSVVEPVASLHAEPVGERTLS
ncbi:glycosyltransferase family 4 protein [Methylibium petroleiphilum]|uniref:Glycosyltransferase-like protein n=1 Tax=Methylibium petroleiphilum (strain ATCC BAA-1232 / LMG 22953 / PM1) TaxID=420662 RepID=A2SDQ7_METPP|nr:glycosyltransferase family 4 protein [Methylibium petroleiphilum]ABM93696.1 glycosyltransferase-like protein [Methylibium petroleiphilum PM1]